ncbi:hydrogenase formation protein HypD [Ammoniphilus resinae]|uniref:Hydrogenase expression/formation protein HypD n=1 Tax=Ammoniphilus resinae TaxID=861532 RepID=A0ABS4GLI4_9BACL|nr:hydrogenase formation protein HypD [Ammoniphilus resinae]MBP1931104.1 hydrogenase expression/formation protein HypD [Ammoniphilus resinae]
MMGMAYRDKDIFASLCQKMLPVLEEKKQRLGRKLRFMEVCGTHTVSFSKTGVREVLADYVDLVSGPGCPVCVTDQSDMDQMIAFAKRSDTIVATFGDMMKVPGSYSNLYKEKADGAEVRIVYSPSQAVEIARQNPQKQVVFLGVGFETTVPSIALSIRKAEREKVRNYFVYSAHKLTPPALQPLIQDPTHQLDGFLLPGHVSVIIGRKGWNLLESLNEPAVIGGFEPIDLLTSIYLLTLEMNKERRSVVNNYSRMVRENGNEKAQELLKEIFEVDSVKWRGFGILPNSGLRMNAAYQSYDALTNLPVDRPVTKGIKGCRCGEIVKGKETPFGCPLFAKACTPENPIGPCMVSSEGTCSTYYQFERGKEKITY